jgi:hypothetical protein
MKNNCWTTRDIETVIICEVVINNGRGFKIESSSEQLYTVCLLPGDVNKNLSAGQPGSVVP